jgi:hypothetical protein
MRCLNTIAVVVVCAAVGGAVALGCGSSTPEPATPEPAAAEGEAAAEEPAAAPPAEGAAEADAGAPAAP